MRRRKALRFGILLHVRDGLKYRTTLLAALLGTGLALAVMAASQTKPQSAGAPANQVPPQSTGTTAAPLSAPPQSLASAPSQGHYVPRGGLSIVVLDPAHGGVDLGARGTEGIRESEVVLVFAAEVRKALEAQGFQVVMTREGNDNPSFDDRSARANAQHGAVFVALHIASTGVAGTARVYVVPDIPPSNDATGLLPWDRAQGPFVGLSHQLGDLVQQELAKRFRGSPSIAQVAPVRQLRTTAAPAIAVEISSVTVPERAELDRMAPGVAEAIAHGVAAFKPSYVLPVSPGTSGGTSP
ncbi:MAG TPA: N-acetylmuramoyl-L-alanine amidase [Verrucomicrobiae bacterium]|nr:N-acetylmuramoyl-L-alanine amidase [Verrucomicrobiae bacterium]